jgi:hypothetical protein
MDDVYILVIFQGFCQSFMSKITLYPGLSLPSVLIGEFLVHAPPPSNLGTPYFNKGM